jgi:hypothetical protein
MATDRNAKWNLWGEGDTEPTEVVMRSTLREYLCDGTMTRADVRNLYRNGETILSGTGGAMPVYMICQQDREPIH